MPIIFRLYFTPKQLYFTTDYLYFTNPNILCMSIPNVVANHHVGRKVERIRELKGMKQDALASAIGVTQQAISKIEQSETVDEEKLKKIADALGVTVDTIKNFNEDVAINNINTFNDNSKVETLITNQYNSVEKIVDLYERLLKEKDEVLKQKDEIIEIYKQQQKPLRK